MEMQEWRNGLDDKLVHVALALAWSSQNDRTFNGRGVPPSTLQHCAMRYVQDLRRLEESEKRLVPRW